MNRFTFKAMVAGLLITGASVGFSSIASASTLTYNLTTNDCSSGCGSGPFGTVTVSSISSTEVSVNLTLAANEVFAVTGAGDALLFDLTGNPTISISNLTTGFSADRIASGGSIHAGGTGHWQYDIVCSGCGNGTSSPNLSGPINFDVTVAGGITPASFIQNDNSLFFATDIGVSNGRGGYSTGDVAAPSVSATPLPAALPLFIGGLGMIGLLSRRRKRNVQSSLAQA